MGRRRGKHKRALIYLSQNMGGKQLTLLLLIYTLLEVNDSIGKCPTACRAEKLFRVVVILEGKDLGACLGLTVAAKAAKSPPGLPSPQTTLMILY